MTLASRYGRTPAQILFRYLTQADVVPLTGMTSAAHMREDLAIFDFELAETERLQCACCSEIPARPARDLLILGGLPGAAIGGKT